MGVPGNLCEMLLPPVGHWLATNVVFTPDGLDVSGEPYDFDTICLNAIAADWAITNTFVDGSPLAATNFVPIHTSGYSGARVAVTNGPHIVTSSQPVGVQVYGFGPQDAYGYAGGVVE